MRLICIVSDENTNIDVRVRSYCKLHASAVLYFRRSSYYSTRCGYLVQITQINAQTKEFAITANYCIYCIWYR